MEFFEIRITKISMEDKSKISNKITVWKQSALEKGQLQIKQKMVKLFRLVYF